MNTSYQAELLAAKAIALKAGEIMQQYSLGDQQVARKGDGTPVTIADTLINRMVIKELSREFHDGIVGEEESTAEYGMGRRWFCDPIDGTKSFMQGLPVAMFSLGLVVDGSPVLGVVYNPFTDSMYEAVTGGRSYCNGQPLSVSSSSLKNGHLTISRGVATLLKNQPPAVAALNAKGIPMTSVNGAIFCCSTVASGRSEGYLDENVGGHDMAAIHIIVECAGGKVTGYSGEDLDYSAPFQGVLVTNGLIHDDLIAAISM